MSKKIRNFKSYITFKGRANRKEYCFFSLINALLNFLLLYTLWIGLAKALAGEGEILFRVALLLFVIYSIVSFLPALALLIRRIRDCQLPIQYCGMWLVPYCFAFGMLGYDLTLAAVLASISAIVWLALGFPVSR